MEALTAIVGRINGFVWGPPMLVLILGTGLFLQLRLGLMPIRRIPTGFRMVWRGRKPDADAPGEISPYAALMTALAATVGTGNIAGVATAIAIGGPGALFWMWMTALVGMATKYSEVLLAVHFRETDDHGEHGLGVLGGHAHQGRHPHPEQRAGPADGDGRADAGDVAGADGGGQRGHQRVERRDVALPLLATAGPEHPEAVAELAQRQRAEPHHQVQAGAENQHQHRRPPDEAVDIANGCGNLFHAVPPFTSSGVAFR